MDVRNALLGAELADDGSDGRIVGVLHTGEQVMLDLVVQTSVHEAQEAAANVRRRDNLLIQEGLVGAGEGLVKDMHVLEVVRDKEE